MSKINRHAMKKLKRRVQRNTRKHNCYCKGNVIKVFAISTVRLVGWPVMAVAHKIHITMKRRNAHPILTSRKTWAIAMGLFVLFISFTIQNLFNHPLWACSIETMRAGGVCPIWESIAIGLNLSKDA